MTMSTLYGYRTADGTYVSPAEAEAEQQRERAGIVAAMRAAGVELNEDAEASLMSNGERSAVVTAWTSIHRDYRTEREDGARLVMVASARGGVCLTPWRGPAVWTAARRAARAA